MKKSHNPTALHVSHNSVFIIFPNLCISQICLQHKQTDTAKGNPYCDYNNFQPCCQHVKNTTTHSQTLLHVSRSSIFSITSNLVFNLLKKEKKTDWHFNWAPCSSQNHHTRKHNQKLSIGHIRHTAVFWKNN